MNIYSRIIAKPTKKITVAERPKLSTRSPRKRWRRSFNKDRNSLLDSRLTAGTASAVLTAPLVSSYNDPKTHPFPLPTPANDDTPLTPTKPALTPTSKTLEKRARFHPWANTTDLVKVAACSQAMFYTGNAHAFVLNLSSKQIVAANKNVKGFAAFFIDRITNNLKVAGVVAPFWQSVDISKLGRLHLQGVIEANTNDIPAIAGALEKAGGKWEALRGSEYQLFLEPLYTPPIWATYCLQNRSAVAKMIKGSPVSFSAGLRARGRALWDSVR